MANHDSGLPADELGSHGADPVSAGDVENELSSIVLRDEHDTVRGGSRFPTTGPPSAGETSSWPERSPSMLLLWRGRTGPRAMPSEGRAAEASFTA
jgi:hypothetical protein